MPGAKLDHRTHLDAGTSIARQTAETRRVLMSHLQLRLGGDLASDLEENYADDVVLLSTEGVNHGHDGVRRLACILRNYVADGAYSYEQLEVAGELGYLRWTAASDEVDIDHGADSFVVRAGRIVAQTVYYATSQA